jgi:hypothetical protein
MKTTIAQKIFTALSRYWWMAQASKYTSAQTEQLVI